MAARGDGGRERDALGGVRSASPALLAKFHVILIKFPAFITKESFDSALISCVLVAVCIVHWTSHNLNEKVVVQ